MPRPHPSVDGEIEAGFLLQFPARRLFEALMPFHAAARRGPECVTVRGVNGPQQEQPIGRIDQQDARDRAGAWRNIMIEPHFATSPVRANSGSSGGTTADCWWSR